MSNSMKSVLIVDDIPYVRKTLKQILSSHGFKVVGEASSGEEAIRLYEETKPDFMTMDLVMPGMNGVEATRAILRNDPHAKIIVLSAMLQENLVTEALLAGAKDYVVKPFQTSDVLKVISSVLSEGIAERFQTAGGAA